MSSKKLFSNSSKDDTYRAYINKMRENSGRQEISNDVQGEGLREIYRGIKRTFGKLADRILPLRTNYPPKVREVLAKYGNEKIAKAFVCRKPLQEAIDFVVRLTSKIDLDDIFHLSMHVVLESGTTLLVEKNDTIRIVVADDMHRRECRRIDGLNGKTLNEVLEATHKKMGKRFFVYRALNDNVGGNCQDFLKNILEANNAHYEGQDPEYSFILQNVYDKVSGTAGTAANFITDLSSRLNRLIYGNGLIAGAIFQCPPNYEFAVAQFATDSWTLPEAEEWMNDNNLLYNRVDSDDGIYNFVKIEPEYITNIVQHVVQTVGGKQIFIVCTKRRTSMAAYGITASDITGWLGKIGGVISDLFVPGSSVALEAAMDNLGSSIDDYIAMKKRADQTRAGIKIRKDVRDNPAFTEWQKSNILDLLNSIEVANKAGDGDRANELRARIEKLRKGDYHNSEDYKKFRSLIEQTKLDKTSKGMIYGWLDMAKNPTNDLTDSERQKKWELVTKEIAKVEQAAKAGKKPMLGIQPTPEQIAAHHTELIAARNKNKGGSGSGVYDTANITKSVVGAIGNVGDAIIPGSSVVLDALGELLGNSLQTLFTLKDKNKRIKLLSEHYNALAKGTHGTDVIPAIVRFRLLNHIRNGMYNMKLDSAARKKIIDDYIQTAKPYWSVLKPFIDKLRQTAAGKGAENPQLEISQPNGAGRRKGADMSKVGATRRYYDIVRKIGETTNIREKNKLEEDAVELAKIAGLEHIKKVHESAPTGKKIGTLSEVMKGEADKVKLPPLGKDEITHGIIAEYKNNVNTKISNLRGTIEGLGATGGRIPGSQVHSVVFPKDEWTQAQAIRWLGKHGYAHPKVDEEANTMRFRQIDPSKFIRFATKPITTQEGKTINLVIGFHTRRRAQAKKQASAVNIGE